MEHMDRENRYRGAEDEGVEKWCTGVVKTFGKVLVELAFFLLFFLLSIKQSIGKFRK